MRPLQGRRSSRMAGHGSSVGKITSRPQASVTVDWRREVTCCAWGHDRGLSQVPALGSSARPDHASGWAPHRVSPASMELVAFATWGGRPSAARPVAPRLALPVAQRHQAETLLVATIAATVLSLSLFPCYRYRCYHKSRLRQRWRQRQRQQQSRSSEVVSPWAWLRQLAPAGLAVGAALLRGRRPRDIYIYIYI